MLDEHLTHADWGIRPILFQVGEFQVTSYAFFVSLALMIGGLTYYYFSRRSKNANENSIYIALAALSGGIIGAKIFIWITEWEVIFANLPDTYPLLSGRTIVGGLIGGTLTVKLTKHILKIKDRRGNVFAPSAAIGIAVGRIGCFLTGCCYGKITSLPWGIDFGDGLRRHPTQIYEAIYCFGLFLYFASVYDRTKTPGILFKRFLLLYFTFRFFLEFIKEGHVLVAGLSIYQVVCGAGAIYLAIGEAIRAWKKWSSGSTCS